MCTRHLHAWEVVVQLFTRHVHGWEMVLKMCTRHLHAWEMVLEMCTRHVHAWDMVLEMSLKPNLVQWALSSLPGVYRTLRYGMLGAAVRLREGFVGKKQQNLLLSLSQTNKWPEVWKGFFNSCDGCDGGGHVSDSIPVGLVCRFSVHSLWTFSMTSEVIWGVESLPSILLRMQRHLSTVSNLRTVGEKIT